MLLLQFGLVLWTSFLGTVGIYFMYVYIKYKKSQNVVKMAKDDQPTNDEGPDVIIIGGGICGATLATVLARDGRRVTVIERSMQPPDTTRGEGFLGGGLDTLNDLGIKVPAKEIEGTIANAFIIHEGPGKTLVLDSERCALFMVHGTLVDALRKRAMAEERCTFIEASVTSLHKIDGVVTGVVYQVQGESKRKILRAPLTVIAEGCHSKNRMVNVTKEAHLDAQNISTEVETTEVLHDFHVFPCSVGTIAMLPLTPKLRRFVINTNSKHSKEKLLELAQAIPDEYRDFYKRSLVENRIRTVPVYHLPPSFKHADGVITLGDAMSIRHPITGSGQMVLLKDIKIVRDLLRNVKDLCNYKVMEAVDNMFVLKRKSHAFAMDLFGLISSRFFIPRTDGASQLGKAYGAYSHIAKYDITRITYGYDTRPHALLYHLCRVVMKAMYDAVVEEPWYRLPIGMYRATAALYAACAIILPHIWDQVMSMTI